MIIVVSALANLLLNIEPSQATTPSLLADFRVQERREDVGQMHLPRVAEISAGEIEILGHDAEGDVFGAEDAADLADHFLDANVGAGVARAVVTGEEQLQVCRQVSTACRRRASIRAC